MKIRYKIPQDKDMRIVAYFAILPVSIIKIEDGKKIREWRWLQMVSIEQIFFENTLTSKWCNVRFID